MKRKLPKRDKLGRFVSPKKRKLPKRDKRGRFVSNKKKRKPTSESAKQRRRIRDLEREIERLKRGQFEPTLAWVRYVKSQPRNIRSKVEPLLVAKRNGAIDADTFVTMVVEAGLNRGIGWALWYAR